MIKATFEMSEDKKSFILSVKGHAEQDDVGHDIVCAAASMLANTLAQVTTDYHELKKLKKAPNIRLDAGDTVIVCKPTKGSYNAIQHAYLIIQRGFELLSVNYPEFVSVTTFGRA